MKNDTLNYTLIDTHCHLTHMINKSSIEPFSAQELEAIHAILNDAQHNNVHTIVEVGTTVLDSMLALELSKIYTHVIAVVGIHPHEAGTSYQEELELLKKVVAADHEKINGIGECGLDNHYPDSNLTAQADLFESQIELALKYDKALVVHTRDAQEQTYAILERYKDDLSRVTIHCYSNDLDFARAIRSWGWFLGIGGTVTYPKNRALREIVSEVGLEGIVLETDAPFLPPQVIRGKKNAPAQIATIAHYLADLLKTTPEEVAAVTTRNAQKLFKLDCY